MKALNVEEQSVQETEQEERVRPVQPRRKQRQLNQKVRYEQSVAEEAVVAPWLKKLSQPNQLFRKRQPHAQNW